MWKLVCEEKKKTGLKNKVRDLEKEKKELKTISHERELVVVGIEKKLNDTLNELNHLQ